MSSQIDSVLTETRVFQPFGNIVESAAISGMDAYQALYDEAERSPNDFWARLARENLIWDKDFSQVLDESDAPFYRWFNDGQLNVSANCLDKHLATSTADRKSTRLNSSHVKISYAVFC